MSNRLKRLERAIKPMIVPKAYNLDNGIYTLWDSGDIVPQDEIRDTDLIIRWV